MKKLLILCFPIMALIGSINTSQAVQLVYNWKPGSSYRFKMNAKDDVILKMNLMGINQESKETYLTETILKLEITSVDASGKALGNLFVESFSVKTEKGVKVAGIETIPAKALKAEVSVDSKGNFTFYKRIFVIVQDKTTLLASAKVSADGTSASASGTAGGTQVTVYAEFDPKSGTLKAGYTEKSVVTPIAKKVETKVEDEQIDIIPYQVLDLLALPDGNTNKGDEVKINSGYYSINIKTIEANSASAIIENTIATNKNNSAATQKINSTSDQGNFNMDMNSMPGMDSDFGNEMGNFDTEMNTNMEGTNSTPKSMMPETNGKFICTFNIAKGMFNSVTGNMSMSQDMMGVKLNTQSEIKLVLLP